MKVKKFLLITSLFYINILQAYYATISVGINDIDTPEGNWVVLANRFLI